MSKVIICFCFLALGLSSCSSTFYVVRHAEKSKLPVENPELTNEGKLRANKLSELLVNKHITKIYSTQTTRTTATAQPLATDLNLTIEIYDAKNQTQFIDNLKSSKQNTLLVGHSNTLKPLVNGLAEQQILTKDLLEHEYSFMYIIKRRKIGKPKSKIITF